MQWVVVLVGVLLALEILDATSLVGAMRDTATVLCVALGIALKYMLENYLAAF